MTTEQLREVHLAQPFRPFTLQLADGTTVHVPHPEFLSYSRTGRTIAVAGSDDVIKIVDVMLVTVTEVGDGKLRKRQRAK